MGRNKSGELRILSRDEDLKLISLVQRWPALYDPEHVSYMDNAKKSSIWSKIGDTLEIDLKICRNRWYNIRDNYRKAMIRNHKKQQLGQDIKMYKYTEELAFLRTYFNLRLDQDSGQDSEPDGGDVDASDAQIEFIDELSSKRKMSPEYEIPNKYVKLELDQEEPGSSEPQPKPGSSYMPCEVPSHEEPHPVDAFLTCVGQTLKSLPPYFLSLAKAEIFATVQKYELKMFSVEEARVAVVTSSDPLQVNSSREQSAVTETSTRRSEGYSDYI